MVSQTATGPHFPVHLNRVLTNMMLFAELRGCRSSALNIRHNQSKLRQQLLNFQSLCLHSLRELRILRIRGFESGI